MIVYYILHFVYLVYTCYPVRYGMGGGSLLFLRPPDTVALHYPRSPAGFSDVRISLSQKAFICGAQRSNYNMRIGFFQSLILIGPPVVDVMW
jgi:hypothetical protein